MLVCKRVHLCSGMHTGVRGPAGCQSSPSSLSEVGAFVCGCKCQAPWSASSWRFFRFCCLPHCRCAGITSVFHLIWIYVALGIQTLFLMMCGGWFIPWDSFSVPVMRLTYADILIGIHIPKWDSTEIPHLCEHVTQAACEHACPYHQGMVLGHGIHENKHTHTTTWWRWDTACVWTGMPMSICNGIRAQLSCEPWAHDAMVWYRDTVVWTCVPCCHGLELGGMQFPQPVALGSSLHVNMYAHATMRWWWDMVCVWIGMTRVPRDVARTWHTYKYEHM